MSAPPLRTRQGLVQLWVVQMVGTLVLCGVVLYFIRSGAVPPNTDEHDWRRYAMFAVLAGGIPALLYLRTFKARLNLDVRLESERGTPDPAARIALAKALSIGSALCEIPMAMGVVYLLFGGETRWFLGATMVTIALRLSYRPFIRMGS